MKKILVTMLLCIGTHLSLSAMDKHEHAQSTTFNDVQRALTALRSIPDRRINSPAQDLLCLLPTQQLTDFRMLLRGDIYINAYEKALLCGLWTLLTYDSYGQTANHIIERLQREASFKPQAAAFRTLEDEKRRVAVREIDSALQFESVSMGRDYQRTLIAQVLDFLAVFNLKRKSLLPALDTLPARYAPFMVFAQQLNTVDSSVLSSVENLFLELYVHLSNTQSCYNDIEARMLSLVSEFKHMPDENSGINASTSPQLAHLLGTFSDDDLEKLFILVSQNFIHPMIMVIKCSLMMNKPAQRASSNAHSRAYYERNISKILENYDKSVNSLSYLNQYVHLCNSAKRQLLGMNTDREIFFDIPQLLVQRKSALLEYINNELPNELQAPPAPVRKASDDEHAAKRGKLNNVLPQSDATSENVASVSSAASAADASSPENPAMDVGQAQRTESAATAAMPARVLSVGSSMRPNSLFFEIAQKAFVDVQRLYKQLQKERVESEDVLVAAIEKTTSDMPAIFLPLADVSGQNESDQGSNSHQSELSTSSASIVKDGKHKSVQRRINREAIEEDVYARPRPSTRKARAFARLEELKATVESLTAQLDEAKRKRPASPEHVRVSAEDFEALRRENEQLQEQKRALSVSLEQNQERFLQLQQEQEQKTLQLQQEQQQELARAQLIQAQEQAQMQESRCNSMLSQADSLKAGNSNGMNDFCERYENMHCAINDVEKQLFAIKDLVAVLQTELKRVNEERDRLIPFEEQCQRILQERLHETAECENFKKRNEDLSATQSQLQKRLEELEQEKRQWQEAKATNELKLQQALQQLAEIEEALDSNK